MLLWLNHYPRKHLLRIIKFFVDKTTSVYYVGHMKKIIFICLIGLVLAACGRMSPPVAPKGSVYPQTYIIKE